MNAAIDRLWPHPAAQIDDDTILATYEFPPGAWLRMNFVSSIDGAATRDGRSGGLGGDADRRVFELLRRQADVILVGAGTVRAEEYGAMRLQDDAVAWRLVRGMPEHPVFALVSGSLDLDPDSAVFTDAPRRPIIYTVGTAPLDRREALAAVADVVDTGVEALDPNAVRADLVSRGLLRVHSEGGPGLFGSFTAAGAVDEMCLTLASSLEAGNARRISHSAQAAPTDMDVAAVLKGERELLLRYVRSEA
ncbi:pyrimidine reductase family protein [Microbacterium sp.]|uniref:pyrimidine reductase family protein n=1 Tax=Microbacterium sp. TaxID=51671 RepID=UPI003A8E6B65